MVGVRGEGGEARVRPHTDGRQIRGKHRVWPLYADVERPVRHWHIRALSKQARTARDASYVTTWAGRGWYARSGGENLVETGEVRDERASEEA